MRSLHQKSMLSQTATADFKVPSIASLSLRCFLRNEVKVASFKTQLKSHQKNDSTFQYVSVDSDDDIVALDDDDDVRLAAKKRSLESSSSATTETSDATGPPVKKAKTVSADDDIVCIE